MAVVPHRAAAASRVAVSEIPGSQILAPEVSMMIRAPLVPHRLRSWASPWATVMIWMPLPPESASQDGTGTGEIWVTSSSAISSGGGGRPPGRRGTGGVGGGGGLLVQAGEKGGARRASPPG